MDQLVTLVEVDGQPLQKCLSDLVRRFLSTRMSKRDKNNNNMVKMAKTWFSGHVLAENDNASTKFANFENGPTFYMAIRINPCMSY